MRPNMDPEPHLTNVYARSIRQAAPDLDLRSIKPLGEGWMSRALLVNDEYVFRFPKEREGSDDLIKEEAILARLAEQTSLALPRFAFKGAQANGLNFVGYKLIPGTLLTSESFALLSAGAQQTALTQIAAFMDTLQRFPVADAEAAGVPRQDPRTMCADRLDALRRRRANVPADVISHAERRVRSFLETPAYHRYEPRLTHGEIAPNHLLFDERVQRLSGIIDFGDMAITDPDTDYRFLLRDLGDGCVKDLMALRGVESIEQTLEKVGYYVTFEYVNEIVASFEIDIPAHWKADAIEALTNESRV